VVKQKVSAPVAAIIFALVILVSLVIFNRPQPAPPDEVFTLPPAPPLEDSELSALRQGLAPLGIALVMPPLGDDRFKGARVAAVAPSGPAGKGGMKAGDLITEFNGVKVTQPFTVAGMVVKVDPNKPSEVVVQRAGKEQKLTITGIKVLPPEERVRF
jgi:S1-C subfamily serine protease